jgi:hypothetical protein
LATRKSPSALAAQRRDLAIARSGHTEHQLRIDLATGEKSQAWIRKQYGLTQAQLNTFMDHEADNIAAIGQAVSAREAVKLRGLWSSQKAMRIAEMQKDVDDINMTIDMRRDEDGTIDPFWGSKAEYANLLRTKTTLLRSIADEIDGTRRAIMAPDDERNVVRYVINQGLSKDLT